MSPVTATLRRTPLRYSLLLGAGAAITLSGCASADVATDPVSDVAPGMSAPEGSSADAQAPAAKVRLDSWDHFVPAEEVQRVVGPEFGVAQMINSYDTTIAGSSTTIRDATYVGNSPVNIQVVERSLSRDQIVTDLTDKGLTIDSEGTGTSVLTDPSGKYVVVGDVLSSGQHIVVIGVPDRGTALRLARMQVEILDR